MLADLTSTNTQTGALDDGVQLEAGSLHAILDFIAGELPNWRDYDERPEETAEETLTSQLAAYLSASARRSGWDILQFRTEVTDEVHKGRTIDLAPSPCGPVIIVEGRRCIEFDMLLPIECKRLPTPKNKGREEAEYVFTSKSTTGGIQRFKEGWHGSIHKLGAMIGYIQKEDADTWFGRVTQWVDELVARGQVGWSTKDHLTLTKQSADIATYHSRHKRNGGLQDIELRHIWLIMIGKS